MPRALADERRFDWADPAEALRLVLVSWRKLALEMVRPWPTLLPIDARLDMIGDV